MPIPHPVSAPSPDAGPTPTPQALPSPAEAAVELTKLSRLNTRQEPPARTRQLLENPFRDLVDSAPSLDAESPPDGGVSQPAEQPPLPSPAESSTAPASLWASPVSESDEVMIKLHQQYLHLMRNPNDPLSPDNWETHARATKAPAEGLETLITQGSQCDIYGILGHTGSIEDILGGLGALSDLNILQAPAPIDVLRLFAPLLEGEPAIGLPSLTRYDHHSITVDSAMHLANHASGPESSLHLSAANSAPPPKVS